MVKYTDEAKSQVPGKPAADLDAQSQVAGKSPGLRSLWITLEPLELIELKRIAMDRDGNGAVAFFREVLVPRLHAAARQRGIDPNAAEEVENNERLSG